jgi:hypothetical protein
MSQIGFSECLRQEILHHKEKRSTFILQKLAFMTSLFGVGFLKTNDFNLYRLFYVIPLVAVAYDVFISAEDFKVKRAGMFIRRNAICFTECELKWEIFVNTNREPWAAYASLVLTIISFLASAVIAGISFPIPVGGFIAWGLLIPCLIAVVFRNYRNLVSTLNAQPGVHDIC